MQTSNPTRALIVAAKLAAPRPPDRRVDRDPSLTASAAAATVVTIVGRAGWGKSVFAAQLVDADPIPTAWLTVDADDDASRFWAHLCRSIERCTGLSRLRVQMQRGGHRGVDALVVALEQVPALRIVLDDVHLLTDPTVLGDVRRLVDLAPPTTRFVLAARPPLRIPLARHLADGSLLALDEDELRFTSAEVATLVRCQRWADADVVARIHHTTDGWPVAVQFAARALHGGGGERGIDSLFETDDALMDYMVEEVLSQQDPDMRRFMVETSILESLDPGLAAAVTGCGDAGSRLAQLAADQVLVTALTGDADAYRYHELIAIVLRRHAQARGTDLGELHTRAAAWCEEHGRVPEAIDHYTAARRFDDAVRMVLPNVRRYMHAGHAKTLATLWHRIPDDALPAGDLELATLWTLVLSRQDDRFQRRIDMLSRDARAGDPLDADIQAGVDTVRAYQAYRLGHFEELTALAETTVVPTDGRGIGDIRHLAARLRARADMLNGDLYAAERTIACLAESVDDALPRAGYELCRAWLALGRRQHDAALTHALAAQRAAEQASEYWTPRSESLLVTGMAHRGLGDLDAAREMIEEAQYLAATVDEPLVRVLSAMELANIELDLGRQGGAAAALRAARRLCESHRMSPIIVEGIDAVAARAGSPGPPLPGGLTQRELEVLTLLDGQRSRAEIAERLYVSVNTVKHHTKSIYRKLAVNDRRHAVAEAARRGLIV